MSGHGQKLRVYLDMCCFNRPYDDQSQLRISLETQAKLHIQELIKDGSIELVTSYTLQYENSQNRESMRRNAIEAFAKKYRTVNIGVEQDEDITEAAKPIMDAGLKEKDAFHLASAMMGACDYFITTDDRVLKHKSTAIAIVDPTEFIRLEIGEGDE